jgi:hypothetical protein
LGLLCSALKVLQQDDSVLPFWLDLIGGKGQAASKRVEHDLELQAGFDGALQMPGAWAHMGAVLSAVAARLETAAKNPNGRRRFFSDFLERAMELSGSSSRDAELHAAAVVNDWPEWAVLCLKVAAPKSGNLWSVWWPIAILMEAEKAGLRTLKSGTFYEMAVSSPEKLKQIRDELELRRDDWVYGNERACLAQVADIFEQIACSKCVDWDSQALQQASLSINQQIGVGAELAIAG